MRIRRLRNHVMNPVRPQAAVPNATVVPTPNRTTMSKRDTLKNIGILREMIIESSDEDKEVRSREEPHRWAQIPRLGGFSPNTTRDNQGEEILTWTEPMAVVAQRMQFRVGRDRVQRVFEGHLGVGMDGDINHPADLPIAAGPVASLPAKESASPCPRRSGRIGAESRPTRRRRTAE
jgi:hypothetical protein